MPLEYHGQDASQLPPAPVTTTQGPRGKAARGTDGNDSGALWWDHDDDATPGSNGGQGFTGAVGTDGKNGGSTPPLFKLTLTQPLKTQLVIDCSGGDGQPGGQGGTGGDGGEGGDGGNSADGDEHPAASGGLGGEGGRGGQGGKGGDGGGIHQLQIVVAGASVDINLISVNYKQGLGGSAGLSGEGGNGGIGGAAGDGGGRSPTGSSGPSDNPGANGADGPIEEFTFVL